MASERSMQRHDWQRKKGAGFGRERSKQEQASSLASTYRGRDHPPVGAFSNRRGRFANFE